MKRFNWRRLAPMAVALGLLFTLVANMQPSLAKADPSNLIANPSAETADTVGGVLNWTPNSWGTSDTTLNTTSDAHSGTKALTITTTSRTNGDAKWMPDAVNVTAGSQYTFSDYYKSTIDTEVDAAYTDASGTVSYYYVVGAPASSDWKQATATVTIPAGAVKAVFMHILPSVGTLTTDDYDLEAYQAPAPTPTPTPVPPSGNNLMWNPSVESGSGNSVANWTPNSWGNNTTTMNITSDAHSGSQALFVNTTVHTDGDSKWMPDPVSVTAGQKYTYTDYYKATAATELDAAYTDASGNVTYNYLTSVAPNTGWAQASYTFTVPATAKTVAIYHILANVGTLTTDDFSLVPYVDNSPVPTPTPVGSNLIPNPSLETANGNSPAGWENSSWGTNTVNFSYSGDAHTGTKSVRTEITSYTDGDAKWYFTPLTTPQAGKTYTFSAWIKATTQVSAVAAFTMADGSTSYVTMQTPAAPNGNWQQYQTHLDIPTGAQNTTVYLLIQGVGYAETDDYNLSLYVPTPFSEGLVSITFDDGWTSTYQNGFPLLKKYGLHGTFFIISGYIGAPMYMNTTQITALKNAANEIGSHTVDHPDLTKVSSSQLTNELQQSQQTIRTLFGNGYANNFATPYGAYNDNVLTQVMKYYRSQRSTDSGFNSKDNFNVKNILVQNVDWDTPNSQVEAWVDQAKAQHTWLVLVYHQVETKQTPGDIYAVQTSNLDTQLKYIKSTNVTVKTVNKSLDEIIPQLNK